MQFREANKLDIPALSRIRAEKWGTEEYWNNRILGYINCELNPQQALVPRMIYVSSEDKWIVGFIAGHLTTRFACNGELQWINVIPEYQEKGIATDLLKLLTKWFIENEATCICVNVEPDNKSAQNFYERHHAEYLNKHWMLWKDIRIILEKL